MSCPPKSVALQKAIAHVLLAPELSGVLCSFNWLITSLLGLGGGGVSDNFLKINHNLLVSAFRCSEYQYTLPYIDLGINKVGSDVSSLLLVRVAQRRGKSGRVCEFGRFSSASDINTISSDGLRDSVSFHQLNQPSVKRLLDRRIPQNVKDKLCIFYRRQGLNRRQGSSPTQKRHKIERQKRPYQK